MESIEISNEELDLIQNCIIVIGELYSAYKIPYDSSLDDIKKAYNNINTLFKTSLNDPKLTKEERRAFEMASYNNDNIYKILSNQRLRNYYDNEILMKFINNTNIDSSSSIGSGVVIDNEYLNNNNSLGYLFFIQSLISQLFPVAEMIQTKIVSKQTNFTSTINVIKSMYRENGLFVFFRLNPLITADLPIQTTIEYIINLIFNSNTIKNENIKSYGKLILGSILRYPFKFILNCISFAPYSMSTLQVIKKIVLRQDEISGKFNFKNLFYAFASDFAIYCLLRGVNKSMKYVERKVIENYNKEKNTLGKASNFWRYTSTIYCNKITKGIISGLLIWPIQMLALQYPYQFVQSYLTNTPIPKVINPISMAIQVCKQQNNNGWKNLFNGLLLVGIPTHVASCL